MHPGAYDPKARLKYMDDMGIWAMVMYPNVGGFGAQELLGGSITKLLTADSIPLMGEMLERKLGGEPRTDYELEIQTKAGKRRTLEISSRLITENGEPRGVQGIARDVTERKVAEEEIRAANERAIVEYEHLLERIGALA